MIQVRKPDNPPAGLQAGVDLTRQDCENFDNDPDGYRTGARTFIFKKTVYGPAAIKNALKAAQHDKCCFCEGRADAHHAGDVEHYRPKGAVTVPGRKIKPGYYWLAYAWANLYYACADCNQYRKRSQFPLNDETARALDHHGRIDAEAPLILDPGGVEDPRDHISFKADVPVWTSPYGEQTIKTLKLDRFALNRDRRAHLDVLDNLVSAVALLADNPQPDAIRFVEAAKRKLAAAVQPEAIFSAAAADYLAAKA